MSTSTSARITCHKEYKNSKEVKTFLSKNPQTKFIKGVIELVNHKRGYLFEDIKTIIDKEKIWDWDKCRVPMKISEYLDEEKYRDDEKKREEYEIEPYTPKNYSGKKDNIRCRIDSDEYEQFKENIEEYSKRIVGLSASSFVLDVMEMLINGTPIMPTCMVIGDMLGIHKEEVGNSRVLPADIATKEEFAKKRANQRAKKERQQGG